MSDKRNFGAIARKLNRNFYGRTKGHGLKPHQALWLEEDLPALSPGPVSLEDNPERTPLDLEARFGQRPIWLEVGFGAGEHLHHMSALYPEIGFIGCEPYLNGVAALLGKLRRDPRDNVAIYPGDVRDLFDVLPEGSIDKAFLLYPDPWPKSRHHRRRFVTRDHLLPLHRALRPGAEFRVATDIADYVRQTMEEVPRAGFCWLGERADDWRVPWADWLSTRYERKALREGRVAHYMTFKRL